MFSQRRQSVLETIYKESILEPEFETRLRRVKMLEQGKHSMVSDLLTMETLGKMSM